MQGALGIGANLNKWTPEESAFATRMVAYYKNIRLTIQHGNLYRLLSPRTGPLTANQYVGEDGKQAVLFAFLHSQQFRNPIPAIRLAGLDAKAVYRVQVLDAPGRRELSGAYLMSEGLTLPLEGRLRQHGCVAESGFNRSLRVGSVALNEIWRVPTTA